MVQFRSTPKAMKSGLPLPFILRNDAKLQVCRCKSGCSSNARFRALRATSGADPDE